MFLKRWPPRAKKHGTKRHSRSGISWLAPKKGESAPSSVRPPRVQTMTKPHSRPFPDSGLMPVSHLCDSTQGAEAHGFSDVKFTALGTKGPGAAQQEHEQWVCKTTSG